MLLRVLVILVFAASLSGCATVATQYASIDEAKGRVDVSPGRTATLPRWLF
ncbi:MAG: hypothetical protein HN341_15020 [Verrucomicrobia bacterium]|jgi:hypothetical protein|nr:hypothetical protein [Verrucomicrobiota bacterium]